MAKQWRIVGSTAAALVLLSGLAAAAAEPEREHGDVARPEMRQPEPHPGPHGYQRLTEPRGWNERPAVIDRGAYQHNFQATRSYRIGPYHRPHGWIARRWTYGQFLPRAYWSAEYLVADYWLFGLEIPPAGYEWVRDDGDALLINVGNGEIVQVVYGVFG
jgi:Ni/Co efflux regulator RcnB